MAPLANATHERFAREPDFAVMAPLLL